MAEGEGASSIIDLIVSLKTEGLGKLDKAKDKVNKSMDSINKASEETEKQMDSTRDSVEQNEGAVDDMGDSFMEATGKGLALLFAGRFLSKTFGGMAKDMLEMMGVTDMFSAALTTVLMPAFLAIQPTLMSIAERFMNMGDDAKMLVGVLVILAAVLAPIIMIGGQILALAAAWGIGFAKVVVAIKLLTGVFAAFVAGFFAGIKIVEKFGPIIGGIIAVVAALIAVFVGGPIVIAAAIGLILGIIWGARDEIVQAVKFIIEAFKNIPDALSAVASSMGSAARNLGSRLVDGMRRGIEAGKDIIMRAIAGLMPGISPDMLGGLLGQVGSSVSGGLSTFGVNDFVMKDGKLLKTHPNDVLFGMKNPNQLGQGGGGGGDVTINVDRPQLNNEMDVDRMIERIKRDLDRDTKGRSGLR